MRWYDLGMLRKAHRGGAVLSSGRPDPFGDLRPSIEDEPLDRLKAIASNQRPTERQEIFIQMPGLERFTSQ